MYNGYEKQKKQTGGKRNIDVKENDKDKMDRQEKQRRIKCV